MPPTQDSQTTLKLNLTCIFLSARTRIYQYLMADPVYEPCPFGLKLRKFALDPVVEIFFKNAEKNTSGGQNLA